MASQPKSHEASERPALPASRSLEPPPHRVRAGIGPRPSAYKFLAPPPCLPAILYSSGLKEIECVHMCSSVAFPGKVQNLLQGKLTMGSGCIHITASLGIKGLDWTSPQLLPSWEGTAQTNTV